MGETVSDRADLDGLIEAMRDVLLRSNRVVGRMLEQNGMSMARIKLLMFVAGNEATRSIDIASALGQAPRTVTEAIDALEREGLVRRDNDPADRRAKPIVITDLGRLRLAEAEPVRRLFAARLFSLLGDEERKAFVEILSKIRAALDTMSSPAQ